MDPFVIKWLLSLIIGSLWVGISTIIAEKISGRIGGLILGLPSTAAIGLLFIGLTQGTNAALTASVIMPFSSGFYCFYYLAYLLLANKGFLTGFVGSLTVWFVFAFLASLIAPSDISHSIIVWLFLVTICIGYAIKYIHINHRLIPKKIVSMPLWLKAALTGIVISLIVLISKLAGPRVGGIFATFPALATSTFLITVKSGGVEFTRLVAKNILISTTITIGLFAILSYLLFPILGIIFGAITAYIGLLIVSLPLFILFINRYKE